MIEQWLELPLALMLVLTMGACLAVHRRLARFRDERAALERIVADLAAAAGRAETALAGLKATAVELDERRCEDAGARDAAAAELRRLLAAAEAGARRLERRIGEAGAALAHPAVAVHDGGASTVDDGEKACSGTERVAGTAAVGRELRARLRDLR